MAFELKLSLGRFTTGSIRQLLLENCFSKISAGKLAGNHCPFAT
jgi:hypothetical protein